MNKLQDILDKDMINSYLVEFYSKLGIDIPRNNDRIIAFITKDILASTDVENFTNEDVRIAFRRFLEQAAESLEETKD